MKIVMDEELNKLKKTLLEMGNHVEEAISGAIKALKERDTVLAKQIIKNDVTINRFEVKIEKICLKIFALKQPMAFDLRFVASGLEINNDIERIGDLAVKIAESVIEINGEEDLPDFSNLFKMAELVQLMLKHSLEAFMEKNTVVAKEVILKDKETDNYHSSIIEQVSSYVHEDSERFENGLSIINISKCLERIGDHCKNICEDTIYLVDGEIVKHKLS